MDINILASWMVLVLYFANFWKDISCNFVRNLEQEVPAYRWIDCELEQPQPWHHHLDSQPTLHNDRNEIAAIFYTTVAPPIVKQVGNIPVPYVYSVHQMIEFNRRQELKQYYEKYYNYNNQISVHMTRRPKPITRPAKPLTAPQYITHNTELPSKTETSTHTIDYVQVTTKNVIFDTTYSIPPKENITLTKKPSSVISLPTYINTVSSLPPQLLELFHNISNYHKAQNSLNEIEQEGTTSISSYMQSYKKINVSGTTERSGLDKVTISLDPRIMNSSLFQFTDYFSATTATVTETTTNSLYQPPASDNDLLNAEDEELTDGFGGFVTVKNDNLLPSNNKILANIGINNITNTSYQHKNTIDVNRIDITNKFIHKKYLLENEKGQLTKDSDREITINELSDVNEIKTGNTSNNEYSLAITDEKNIDKNSTITKTDRHILPSTSVTTFTIDNTYNTSETSKITTVKSEITNYEYPNMDMDNVENKHSDFHEINYNMLLKASTITKKMDQDLDISTEKFSIFESTTLFDKITIENKNDLGGKHYSENTNLSIEDTTIRTTDNSNNNSKKKYDLEKKSLNYNEISLTATNEESNITENIDDNYITVTTETYHVKLSDEQKSELSALQPDQNTSTKRSYNDVKEFETATTFYDDAEIIGNSDDYHTNELVTQVTNDDQSILFNDVEEKVTTLPTNRITDFGTKMAAVESTVASNGFVSDNDFNTEIDIGESLIELPKYAEVESVTEMRKVIEALEPANGYTSVPSNGMEIYRDDLEKNIIDINIKNETLVQDPNSPTVAHVQHRRTEKMLENGILIPQYNNIQSITENGIESITLKSIYTLPNMSSIVTEINYDNNLGNQIIDIEKVDPEYIYVGEESTIQNGKELTKKKETQNNTSSSTLSYELDYETGTDSISSDLSKFTEKERIKSETQNLDEGGSALIDLITNKVNFGTYDEINNNIHIDVNNDDLTGAEKNTSVQNNKSSNDDDLYEEFLRKNLTAGAKIMK